jgi:hypothetical protein
VVRAPRVICLKLPEQLRKGQIMLTVVKMRGLALLLAAAVVLSPMANLRAGTEENAEEFMDLHKVEIAFHEAGSTKNLDLMLSLFADDAVLTAGGKTYIGKDQIKSYWQAAGPFQPQNQILWGDRRGSVKVPLCQT